MNADKLLAAVAALVADVRQLFSTTSALSERLDAQRPPDLSDIVSKVLAEVPEPEEPDVDAIVKRVLAEIPTPRDGERGRDGRDAPTVSVTDVAAVVLAQIPKPKDGVNGRDGTHGRDGADGPSLDAVVRKLRAQVKEGRQGPPGPPGPKGKDGTSVTKVELDSRNTLFVWLDGVKRRVGQIALPAPKVRTVTGGGGGTRLPEDFARTGFFDYADLATQTTPVVIPDGLVNVDIPNDTLGPFTLRTFAPKGVQDIWNGLTDRFDFTPLRVGDTVGIRLEITITTTSPNQRIVAEFVGALGTGSQYTVPVIDTVVKQAGPVKLAASTVVYIGNADTRENPAKLQARSDDPATLVVSGWFTQITLRG